MLLILHKQSSSTTIIQAKMQKDEMLVSSYYRVRDWLDKYSCFFIAYKNYMGQSSCCGLLPPHPLPSKPREKSLIKIPLVELQNYTQPHYFFLLWSDQYFRNNFLAAINQTFPNITIFSDRAQMAAYDEDGRINVLIITCDNPNTIGNLKLAQLPNLHVFSQIAVAQMTRNSEGPIQRQVCQREMGFRFARIIDERSDEMASFMNEAKEGRAVYFCHRDRGHINQINILFDYLLRNGEESSSVGHFFQWARSLREDQGFINRLETLPTQQARCKQIALNICSYSKVCIQIFEMLRRIRNPCVLAHIAWFCSTLYKFIQTSYQTFRDKPVEERVNKFVAWVGLTKEDIQAMREDQNFMFSTFVIGSSGFNQAQPEDHPDLTYYKFTINLRDNLNQYDRLVDLGLLEWENKVIFNLQNMFRLESCNHLQKVAEATYCSVGPQYTKKKIEPRYSTYPTPHPANVRMMDTYDVYHLYRRNIKCQLDLILALQFYHFYKRTVLTQLRALPQTNTTTQTAATTNILLQTAATVHERLRPTNGLLDKIGDSYLSTCNFAAAEEAYNRIQRSQVRLAKLLYLYFTNANARNSRRSFRQTMDELEQNRPQINETLAHLNRHIQNQLEHDETHNSTELQLKRRVVRAGYLSYVVQLFRAVLLGYTDYKSALSANRANQANIANYFTIKYVKNIQPTPQMPPVKISHHNESLNYFPLSFMATKVNLELEQMNGSVGVKTMRKELQQTRKKTDGLHFFFLPQND